MNNVPLGILWTALQPTSKEAFDSYRTIWLRIKKRLPIPEEVLLLAHHLPTPSLPLKEGLVFITGNDNIRVKIER